ncbi:MAG: TolC family protein [Spirochaetaceae bacterium]|nr:MAG: TolC family protein [Spirochaetaceae bacterium]
MMVPSPLSKRETTTSHKLHMCPVLSSPSPPNISTRMKTIITYIIMLGSAFTGLSGLSLDQILHAVDQTPDVRLASLRYEAASLQVDRSNSPIYPSLSVTPVARATGSSEFPDISRVGIAGSITLDIPLGRGAEQLARDEALAATAMDRQAELALTRDEVLLDVVRRYHTTWLQMELASVLAAEREAARSRYDADRHRYERGEITLATLIRSEQSLQEAETSVNRVLADRALQLHGLSMLTGLVLNPEDAQNPPPILFGPQLPDQSSDRAVDLRSTDLNLLRRQTEYERLNTSETPVDSVLEVSRISTSFAYLTTYGDISASIGLSPNSRSASVSYQIPEIVLVGDTPSPQTRWNASISVSVSIDPNIHRDLTEAQTRVALNEAAIHLELAEARLTETEQRAAHDLITAREALDTALEQPERSRQTREIVSVQILTGRATSTDELVADAAILRSEYAVHRAQLELEQAAMRANPEQAARVLETLLSENMEDAS